MAKTVSDEMKSCEKIPTSFSRYITTLISGYFMGKPVSYSIPDEELSTIISMNRNKEISHNASLEKDASIFGVAYELLYLDSNKNLQFTKINPQQIILIYSNEIDGELLYAIRFWDDTDILTSKETMNVEVYSDTDIKIYKQSSGGLELIETKIHYFKNCPIIPIFNNSDKTGDSQCIHKLIDCYDKSISSSQDFFNELNDSYLVIYNSDLDDETIRKMKSNRIFAVDSADTGGNAKIEWLTRDGKNSESENFNNRIVDDILTFSFVKDLQQASKSHISAESTKMGLMGVEQLCVEKETYFRTALMKRLEIICNVYNLFGNDFNVDDVKITFVRNIPQNLGVIANNVNLLKDTVSTKTLLSQIPFVQSVDDELKQLEEERKNNYDNEIKTETIVQ